MRKIQFLAPLALVLAVTGCGQATESETAAPGEAIAAIAAPEGTKWSTTVNVTEDGGYVMGNPEAPIKLVEYMSLTCGACAQFGEQAFDGIRDKYVESGRVSFEIRNFVRDPADLSAALLTRCSTEQAFFPLTKNTLGIYADFFQKFIDLNNSGSLEQIYKLPEDQRFVKIADEIGLISFFQTRGVSEDQAKACLSDSAKLKQLTDWTSAYAKKDDVQGTPTFLLNGQKIDGIAWSLIETKMQEAGAR